MSDAQALLLFALPILLVLAVGFALKAKRKRDRKAPPPTKGWMVGPEVYGENRSPRSVMVSHPGALLAVEIPHGTVVGDRVGELSGLTYVHGPLSGTRIKARFRIEAEPGAAILASQPTEGLPAITLFFQRKGDNWSGRGKYETYRWYAVFAAVRPVEVNRTYEIDVPLDGPWTAVKTSSALTSPQAFAEAKADAESVGFVFGGGDGYAHGLYATGGKARLIVEDFGIE